MTLADSLIVEAQRYLKVREAPTGSNRGVEIDYFIRECGLDPKGGFAWCAAFVGQMGRQTVGQRWPCPRTALVADLAAWAQKKAPERWYTDPERGDLFCVYHEDLKRYAHIGIVASIARLPDGRRSIGTVEGNANPGGGREGFGVFELTRTVPATMMFIRWTAAIIDEGRRVDRSV